MNKELYTVKKDQSFRVVSWLTKMIGEDVIQVGQASKNHMPG